MNGHAVAPGEWLWPDSVMTAETFAARWERLRPAFLDKMRQHRLPEAAAANLAAVYLPLAAWVHARKSAQPLILGIHGAQGSGKSTLCDFLAFVLNAAHGDRVAVLSIDDFYKTRAERERMARAIHPLFVTRGVPGTHDVGLGLDTLGDLKNALPDASTPLPAFDKARDDRRPATEWPLFRGRPDTVLFEGWCVGAAPQAEAALREPVNALERDEDPFGIWRRYANERLRGDYARWFAELDGLIMLRVPGMNCVLGWRGLQESKLAENTAPDETHRLMDPAALRHFVMHYERLTRHCLEEMPGRADLTLFLDKAHRFERIRF